MESPQARHDAPANPAGKAPLVQVPGREDLDLGRRQHLLQLLARPVHEAPHETARPRHHDVPHQQRARVDVHRVEALLHHGWNRELGVRGRVLVRRQGRARIEQPLRGLELLRAEDLVVAVRKFEGPRRLVARVLLVADAAARTGGKAAAFVPDLDNGLLEFVQDALFL